MDMHLNTILPASCTAPGVKHHQKCDFATSSTATGGSPLAGKEEEQGCHGAGAFQGKSIDRFSFHTVSFSSSSRRGIPCSYFLTKRDGHTAVFDEERSMTAEDLEDFLPEDWKSCASSGHAAFINVVPMPSVSDGSEGAGMSPCASGSSGASLAGRSKVGSRLLRRLRQPGGRGCSSKVTPCPEHPCATRRSPSVSATQSKPPMAWGTYEEEVRDTPQSAEGVKAAAIAAASGWAALVAPPCAI